MAQHTRSELYKIYKGGFHDKAFEHLVDSSLNSKDDGIGVNSNFGLALTPKGPSKNLVSFFEKISDKSGPMWRLQLATDSQNKGFNIMEGDNSRLFIQSGGKVGVGTESPNYKLEVRGLAAVKGIVGTFAYDVADADGEWHDMPGLQKLHGCQAFEIFAHINDEGDRRFALTQATMLMSNGKRGYETKVKTVDAGSSWLWGKFFNKIKLRWVREENYGDEAEDKYKVQVKTRTHYGMRDGQPKKIFYRVTKLWDKTYEDPRYLHRFEEPAPRYTNNPQREEQAYTPPPAAAPPRKSTGIKIKR
ncbi:MAG: hypothetical protein ACI85O_001442 [Saprospiraceae bacterium]|jgi:hypothetical protein